jgi:hypothetical protein
MERRSRSASGGKYCSQCAESLQRAKHKAGVSRVGLE